MRSPIRILLAGGGTGGHVYPLLAIIEALDFPVELHWLGSERSESRIVPQYSQQYGVPIEFHQIDIRFSYRLPTPRNWRYYRQHIIPLVFGRPFRQSLQVINALRPDIVFASGGYVSAPALWAARQHSVPFALLQLDAAVGLVNAYFAASAARVYASTERAAKWFDSHVPQDRVLVPGFPARRPRLTREQVFADYGFDASRRLFVIMGGSLGTGAIAEVAAETIELLDRAQIADSLAVLFSAGERMDTARAIRDTGPQRLQFSAVDYIGDSVSVLAAADFYLGRSGASTVAELIATGPQSLLIPDPQHRDRQQFHNAEVLVERGQAALLEQRNASGPAVVNWLNEAWDRPRGIPPQPSAAKFVASDLRALLLR